jgi:hypothetical protein
VRIDPDERITLGKFAGLIGKARGTVNQHRDRPGFPPPGEDGLYRAVDLLEYWNTRLGRRGKALKDLKRGVWHGKLDFLSSGQHDHLVCLRPWWRRALSRSSVRTWADRQSSAAACRTGRSARWAGSQACGRDGSGETLGPTAESASGGEPDVDTGQVSG